MEHQMIKESLATLYRALELGINFLDTADIYANGINEKLISNILKDNREKIFIATKFGFRQKDGVNYIDDFSQMVERSS